MGSSGRVAGVVALAALLGAGAAVTPPDGDDRPRRAARPSATAIRALAALDELPVRAAKGRATEASVRSRFGTARSDPDGDGCDTTDEVLRRDLRRAVVAADGCTVTAGTLTDPYTGAVVRYPDVALRLDRVVALDDAWATGAARLSAARRTALAGDPLNLLVTTPAAARRRAGADASRWLPRRGLGCAYVARRIAVRRAYGLWVTPAERAAMVQVLAGCPGQLLPTTGTPMLVRRSPLPASTTDPLPTDEIITAPADGAGPDGGNLDDGDLDGGADGAGPDGVVDGPEPEPVPVPVRAVPTAAPVRTGTATPRSTARRPAPTRTAPAPFPSAVAPDGR